MEYKPGDKVRVLSKEEIGFGYDSWCDGWYGEVMTIKYLELSGLEYYIHVEENQYTWDRRWLEPYTVPDAKPVRFDMRGAYDYFIDRRRQTIADLRKEMVVDFGIDLAKPDEEPAKGIDSHQWREQEEQRVLGVDYMSPEVHIAPQPRFESPPERYYKCRKCARTGTKAEIKEHMRVMHKEFIGLGSPLWVEMEVKEG